MPDSGYRFNDSQILDELGRRFGSRDIRRTVCNWMGATSPTAHTPAATKGAGAKSGAGTRGRKPATAGAGK